MVSEIEDRVTVKVADMRKQPEDTLPYLCAQQQIWALMKESRLGANLPVEWKVFIPLEGGDSKESREAVRSVFP